ncbi:Initiator Replication protein [Thiothrix eikelboomii]|uniref:Initiator Replication protein n=1 Tax=Thiothrix eikelboomii TaxID=92487 RepID=A0A1T4Y7V3_9GAMM|nr:replication initiation protein [Thiothrix eikelboomii]SKA97365.1 Initiator Replication protein [Thiothrix eikelboomii]
MATKEHKQQVSIANDLIKSAQGLNIGEKRLLMLAVSKLDSKIKPSIQGAAVSISVAEMVEMFGLNSDKAYQEAKKAAEGIMKRQIRIKPNNADSELIQWVGKSKYNKGEGWILVEFYYGLFPYLFELKSHFTSYRLSRASGLQSVYSWRLFELLMQFKKTGLLNILIDDFHHSLETPKTYHADFSLLKARVIEPAVKEIREKDGLAVEWEAIKAGRKVKALKFTFPTEQQLSLDTHPKALNSANTPRTEQGAKTKKGAKQEIEAFLSLSETKSRLQSAKELARLAKVPAETYLTEKDRASIAHYELTI